MTRGSVDDALLRDRVERYLHQRIAPAALVGFVPANVSACACDAPVPFEDAAARLFSPAAPGDAWGAPWTTTWLRVSGAAPQPPAGCRVELVIDLGFTDAMPGFQAEGLAFRPDGAVVKAINPTTRWLPVDRGASYEFLVEAAANPVVLNVEDGARFAFTPTLLGDPATAGSRPQYRLGAIGVEIRDVEVDRLGVELEVLTELGWSLPESSARRARVLAAVDRALDSLDPGDVRGTAAAARAHLSPVLADRASPNSHEIVAVGHAHIDSAWLWPFRETRRKVARTVANVLERMDADPALVYAMSSAQQYAWLKEDHPRLYERVRRRVSEGRFLPVGGMWVESDVEMPSGESLVRQFVHGSRFFEREFGVPTTLGWLPDSFGYSGALPQILRSAGARSFVTQKMSWSLVNRFPHHTFAWEGIDGSRVTTHFPSVDTYNSALTGHELAHAAANLTEPDLFDASIAPFGYGDGGGGPTREMLERARLTADLEGSPRVVLAGPSRFFGRLEEEVESGLELPVWLGELYLEAQRGVYTSQAKTKEAHRKVESLLREAELWGTHATLRADRPYPYSELDDMWQELLLMEFHDVLPGSSIAWVHQEAENRLNAVIDRLSELIDTSLDALSGARSTLVTANPSPFARQGAPGQGIAAASAVEAAPTTLERRDREVILRNAVWEAVVDMTSGAVTSLRDIVRDREVVSAGGRLHLPTLHKDSPVRWDAWDIDASIDSGAEVIDVVSAIDARELDDGGAAVEVARSFGASQMTQQIVLPPGDAALHLHTRVDWQEREKLLKLEFPLAIAADRWQAETQFGIVERPTHRNTSWDAAQFEACAHRWVRVAESDYGVALVNSRTYGYDARRFSSDTGPAGVRVRASLLRSARYPDPEADRGTHDFHFALLPAVDVGDAVRAAYELNDATRSRWGEPIDPLVVSSAAGVVVETIKMAEDRSGDMIVRMYESRGTRTRTSLELGIAAARVIEVDILERPIDAGPDIGRLEFTPFRFRTFRVTPEAARADGTASSEGES